uniref:Uncharacterized protein n=1 Tax=Populus trichocarpa TaxID=3694 RepID=A0A2K2A1Y6_POPTR
MFEDNLQSGAIHAVVQAVSLSCQSTAAASIHQGLLPTLFYPIYRVSDHSTSISFIGLQFLFIFCLLYELLHLPFQEFMLDTHLMKASCEDCGAACGHFRLLDWALANQLILDLGIL